MWTNIVMAIVSVAVLWPVWHYCSRMRRIVALIKRGDLRAAYDPAWIVRQYIYKLEADIRDMKKSGTALWQVQEIINLMRFMRICRERGCTREGFYETDYIITHGISQLFIYEGIAVFEELKVSKMQHLWSRCQWAQLLYYKEDPQQIGTMTDADWTALVPHLPYLQMEHHDIWMAIRDRMITLGHLRCLGDMFREKRIPMAHLEEMSRVVITPSNFEEMVELCVLLGRWDRIWTMCGMPAFEHCRHIALLALDKAGQLQLRPQEAKTEESKTPAKSESAS